MDEAIKFGKMLHDTPDLFPWVCLAMLCIIIISQRKRILAYFDARIDAYNSKRESDAVMAELIRNNTAALNNNTAALESVRTEREATMRMLEYHEKVSKERIEHLQTIMNRIDDTVSQNEKDITIIKESRR